MSPSRLPASATFRAAAGGKGLGRLCGSFGPRTAERAEPEPDLCTAPCPSRSRKRAKARLAASARISERGLRPSDAPRRDEGAHVARRESADGGKIRRRAEMGGEEAQERRDVALIGLDGLGAHPPLAGQDRRANAWPPRQVQATYKPPLRLLSFA